MDGDIVQVSDDGVIYRASALGGCRTALVAARLEFETTPVPAKVQGYFDAGHRAEDVVVAELLRQGFVVENRELEVVLTVSDRVKVVGHIDGTSNGRIVEIKSQSKAEYDKFEREGWESGFFPRYKWQTSVYEHALGLPLMLVRVQRDDDGEVVAGSLSIRVYETPWYSEAEIRARVLSVEAEAASGVLSSTCDLTMYPCPYVKLHPDETWHPDPETTAVVDKVARRYALDQAERDRHQKHMDDGRDFLRAYGEDKIETDNAKATFWTSEELVDIKSSSDDPWKLVKEKPGSRITWKGEK